MTVKQVVYSTKVEASTQKMLDALARTNGAGHRVLLEDMLALYVATNPDKAARAQAYMDLMAGGFQQAATVEAPVGWTNTDLAPEVVMKVEIETPPPAFEIDVPVEPQKIRLIQTVQYQGSDTVHLYEPGRKNSTGCSLAGELDQESIKTQEAGAVDCGKCRYCRKTVFKGV